MMLGVAFFSTCLLYTSLGGDQAMEIHGLQQVGLDEDRAHQIALDAHHLHMGVADRALGQGVHITLPLVGAQILSLIHI